MSAPVPRRRFLTLVAAACACPLAAAEAAPVRWRGVALGAEASLTIHAPRKQAERALRDARRVLARVERLFSLYDPASHLSRLNAEGALDAPDPAFVDLLRIAGEAHAATGGLFDPTIQPLWRALAEGRDPDAARDLVGWDRVRISADRVSMAPGQALTLNGIAQGYATDLAATAMREAGLSKVLVNIGEFTAVGGPFQLGVEDPVRGLVATRTLENRALATSSPAALRIADRQTHILHPHLDAKPLWPTVTVEADSAAVADAASTAFCLMDKDAVSAALSRLPGAPTAILVSTDGGAETLD